MLDHEHALALGMALVDRALARGHSNLDDFGHKIEAIGIALVIAAVVDHNNVRLGIVVRRDRCEIETDALIRHSFWAMRVERIDEQPV